MKLLMARRSMRTIALAGSTLLALVGSTTALASGGPLDDTFGGDGKVTTAVGSADDRAFAVAIQADGRIVAVGSAVNGNEDIAVVRYNTDGSLDTSFDSDGRVSTAIGSNSEAAQGVAIQSDGKIVVVGRSKPGVGDADFAVVRYNTNGSLDTGFDSDGVVTTDIGGSKNNCAKSVALQPDGKIVVAGWIRQSAADCGYFISSPNQLALVRYNTDGSLDTTFSGDGIVVGPVDQGDANAVAVQPNGKVVVAGGDGYDFRLRRYDSDGSPDATFGSGGAVTTNVSGTDETANAMALMADGRIVVAGFSENQSYFALVRYSSDGSLDTSFDVDGKVTTNIGTSIAGSDDAAEGVSVQSDGKVVAVGFSRNTLISEQYVFSAARYDVDGTLDPTFDSDGKVTTPIGNPSEAGAHAVAIQADGNIVVAGHASNGIDYDFALTRYLGDSSPTDTSLAIKAPSAVAAGSKAKIVATLTSDDPNCRDSQTILLKSGSATVGSKTSDSSGHVTFRMKITKKVSVRANYAGSSTCGPSASPKTTIKPH